MAETAMSTAPEQIAANRMRALAISADARVAGIDVPTLKEQGINVARRTIAKYRESMGIAPSNERKQLP